MAKVTQLRSTDAEETRIQLDRCDFFELTSAHGEIFEAQARWTVQLAAVRQKAYAEVAEKQAAFDALVKKHTTAAGHASAIVKEWDKETCELILG